jgi:antitoxin component YwqK of YwqJK toxin-antitoxin module
VRRFRVPWPAWALAALALLPGAAPDLRAADPPPGQASAKETMEQAVLQTLKKSQPAPTPTPTPSPGPSPLPSPSMAPAPPPLPSVAIDPAALRVAWPGLPVGASLALSGGSLTVWRSNRIGLQGAPIGRRGEAVAGAEGCDPGPGGDAWVRARLAKAGQDQPAAWSLVVLEGTVGGQRFEWSRLVDDGGAVAWFRARSWFGAGKSVRREETWKEGAPEFALDYDEAGRVLTEYRYAAGAAASGAWERRSDFAYRGKLLAGRLSTDAAGKTIETVSYAHTLDGRIRQTERRDAAGNIERFVYRYGESGLSGSWADDTALGQSWQYDASGRLVRQEQWKDGKVASRISVTWADIQGTRMASRETEDTRTGARSVEAFDERGQVVQIEDFIKDESTGRTSQEWDADGRLVLRGTVGPAGSESWTGEYAEGKLAVERYSKNGLPVKVVHWQGDDRTEEIYLAGVLRLRAWFRGPDKYKEEDIRDGQVYRTRNLDRLP